MARMMKQPNLITYHVTNSDRKQQLNVVHAAGNLSYECEPRQICHEEVVCFIGSRVLGSRLAFQ